MDPYKFMHICLAYMPSYAPSQRRWSCSLDITFLQPDGTCSYSLFVSWMDKIVVQPHDTLVLILLHVSSPAHGTWVVSLCKNCDDFVIWVGKHAAKEKYILNRTFKFLENICIVHNRDSILNYIGDKDQEIWGKKHHCHSGNPGFLD